MSVLFTDSNCELWWDKTEKLGMKYISMPYTLDDQQYYYDLGKNHDDKMFYQALREGKMPITSALNPQNYVDIFTPYLQNGQDILYVHFSRKLSGTFDFLDQAIAQLKKTFPDQTIRYVDTKSISLGAGVLVYEAGIMHKRGCTDEEIIQYIENERDHISTYFTVDDLKHLVRGGRLGATSAFFGGILGIKPILKVSMDGKIEVDSKASGRKKSILQLVEYLKQNGSNVADYPIGIIHGDSEADAKILEEKVRAVVGQEAEIWVQPIGPTIGTHCGPGALGLIFHSKNK